MIGLSLVGGVLLCVTGCGSVQHKASFNNTFVPPDAVKIAVGTVTNETGQQFDVGVEQLLMDALAEKLRKKNMLSDNQESSQLSLTCKIVEYEKGDAFKRWLLPGWGSTVLSVQGDLKDKNGIVGTIQARRTISIGGGYSVGAWRTVFASLADDIVKDISSGLAKSTSTKPK